MQQSTLSGKVNGSSLPVKKKHPVGGTEQGPDPDGVASQHESRVLRRVIAFVKNDNSGIGHMSYQSFEIAIRRD